MIDFATLLELGSTVALVVVPALLLRRLGGADGPNLADLFAAPTYGAWPRGVQEEEPVRWRVELLRPRAAAPLDRGVRIGHPIPGSDLQTRSCA